jgi:hypothetical protein
MSPLAADGETNGSGDMTSSAKQATIVSVSPTARPAALQLRGVEPTIAARRTSPTVIHPMRIKRGGGLREDHCGRSDGCPRQ